MVHVEGTTISEGRGTTRPFELTGAPHLDPYALVESLESERIPGVRFRPCFFQPTFQKHAGTLCAGVQLHVTDRSSFPSVLAGIAVLRAMYAQDPARFAWKQPPYEYVYETLPFDVIAGTATLREQIVASTPLDDIAAGWAHDEAAFRTLREPYLLY